MSPLSLVFNSSSIGTLCPKPPSPMISPCLITHKKGFKLPTKPCQISTSCSCDTFAKVPKLTYKTDLAFCWSSQVMQLLSSFLK
ncbi:hypothetical protein JHK85_006860 [Glycine max]|uniref:Uncharacterized protein n=1 Tax=Glycine max TaxID=3847 RepID=A0A0R0K703_SOYBN|nr:hypothetical protein JHK85_006860 [Glycine max]